MGYLSLWSNRDIYVAKCDFFFAKKRIQQEQIKFILLKFNAIDDIS